MKVDLLFSFFFNWSPSPSLKIHSSFTDLQIRRQERWGVLLALIGYLIIEIHCQLLRRKTWSFKNARGPSNSDSKHHLFTLWASFKIYIAGFFLPLFSLFSPAATCRIAAVLWSRRPMWIRVLGFVPYSSSFSLSNWVSQRKENCMSVLFEVSE